MNRIAWMDRPTGRIIRRIDTDRPGELVDVDAKKLGRHRPGGGWRMRGRNNVPSFEDPGRIRLHPLGGRRLRVPRLAYSEIHADERGPTCAGFWECMFRPSSPTTMSGSEAVLSDNAKHGHRPGLHRRSRADPPPTDQAPPPADQREGRQRFNRTLLDEWAYVRLYRSNADRTRDLHRFLHTYNHHRGHTALKGRSAHQRHQPTWTTHLEP